MRVAVNYRGGTKQLKKIALHLKSTLARPTIYDQAYHDKLSTASPGNAKDVTKHRLVLLFVEQDEKTLEEPKSLEKTNFSTNIGKKKSVGKVRPEPKIASKPTAVYIVQPVLRIKRYALLWGTLKAPNLYCRNLSENYINSENFRPKSCGKIGKLSAKYWMQPTFPIP